MIPKCYYEKNILKSIDYNIKCGYDSFESLEEHDKDELSALCIRALGDDSYTCIVNDGYENISDILAKYMLAEASPYELAESIRQNSVKYFTDVLSELYSECYENVCVERSLENGLVQRKHADNGETYWVQGY